MADASQITEQQRVLAEAYLETASISKASERAGYAHVQSASRVLKRATLVAYLEERRAEIAKKSGAGWTIEDRKKILQDVAQNKESSGAEKIRAVVAHEKTYGMGAAAKAEEQDEFLRFLRRHGGNDAGPSSGDSGKDSGRSRGGGGRKRRPKRAK